MADPLKASDASVYLGGTSTAMVAEATTDVGGTHTVYQITAATKRVLDPDVAVVVDSDGTPVSAAAYTLDYNNGKVTFTVARGGAEVITFDANYIPKLLVAMARKASLVDKPIHADVTRLGDTGPRKFFVKSGLEVKLDTIHSPNEDLDTGDGTTKLATALLSGASVFLEVNLSASVGFRGWFKMAGELESGLEDVMGLALTFEAVLANGLAPPSAIS